MILKSEIGTEDLKIKKHVDMNAISKEGIKNIIHLRVKVINELNSESDINLSMKKNG